MLLELPPQVASFVQFPIPDVEGRKAWRLLSLPGRGQETHPDRVERIVVLAAAATGEVQANVAPGLIHPVFGNARQDDFPRSLQFTVARIGLHGFEHAVIVIVITRTGVVAAELQKCFSRGVRPARQTTTLPPPTGHRDWRNYTAGLRGTPMARCRQKNAEDRDAPTYRDPVHAHHAPTFAREHCFMLRIVPMAEPIERPKRIMRSLDTSDAEEDAIFPYCAHAARVARLAKRVDYLHFVDAAQEYATVTFRRNPHLDRQDEILEFALGAQIFAARTHLPWSWRAGPIDQRTIFDGPRLLRFLCGDHPPSGQVSAVKQVDWLAN